MAFRIKSAFITDPGLNPNKKVNEDSILVLEKQKLFAVADGVGGAHAGDLASQTAVKTIGKLPPPGQEQQSDGGTYITQLVAAANDAVFELSKKTTRTIASTVAVMTVFGDTAYIGHVGDSRIYIFRDGLLSQLTRDHSQVQEMLDRTPGSPLVSETKDDQLIGRNVITQALGAEPEVKPDIQKIMLRKKDIFLLCTDGIYTCISNKELSEIVADNPRSPEKVCNTFLAKCYDRGANDHLSAIVIRIK